MVKARKVVLRSKRLSDAKNDYQWQKDIQLARLDAAPPVDCTLDEFLSDYASELLYPAPFRRSFAVETLDGKHIGNCVYYNIDEDRGEAEIGIMIGDRNYWNKGYGTDAIRALLDHIFRHASLSRVYLKTLVNNTRAQQCFRKCGFAPCGYLERDGYSFLLMDMTRQRWQEEQGQEGTQSST